MLKKFKKATAPPPPSNDSDAFETPPVRIAYTFGGGGAQGAFILGVLEAIAEDVDKIGKTVSVSGTSAGTFTAILFGSGLNAGGVKEGIRRLIEGWDVIKSSGNIFGRSMRFLSDVFLPKHMRWPNLLFNPTQLFNGLSQFVVSIPAQFISTTVKNIVKNWEAEVQHGAVKISGNTVLEKRDNPHELEHVVLERENLTPDGAGASANIRNFGIHYIQDVPNPELRGRRAFDGAYKINGPLTPHIEQRATDCIMIILHDRRHNTLDHGDLKHADIHSNVLDLIAEDSHAPMRFHAIELQTLGGEIDGLSHIDDSSKMNTDPAFIEMMRAAGRKAGKEWFQKNGHCIGKMSSYDFYEPALNQFAVASYA